MVPANIFIQHDTIANTGRSFVVVCADERGVFARHTSGERFAGIVTETSIGSIRCAQFERIHQQKMAHIRILRKQSGRMFTTGYRTRIYSAASQITTFIPPIDLRLQLSAFLGFFRIL